jgi:hypothetical protein
MLTDVSCRNAKGAGKAKKLSDGGGRPPGFGYSTSASSTPMRLASPRASSKAGPRSWAVEGSLNADVGLIPEAVRNAPYVTRKLRKKSSELF